jgi:ABC-type multidrug transport system ATPase subunit
VADILGSIGRAFPPIVSFWDRPAHVYSRGQAALIALARVLMTPRPVWLLDEPTAGLDQETADLVRRWLLQEAALGRTIVLCTHLPEDITGLCHQVLRIADGGAHPVETPAPPAFPEKIS